MDSHINQTESEEMYLVTIAQLIEEGEEPPISLTRLAEVLGIQPVSVNQMIHKLTEVGLVNYLPYKGVELSTDGLQIALHVLRHRRLWEVFLVEHLELPFPEAEELACRFEHTTPCDVAQRLASFLDEPVVSPQGKTIPAQTAQSFASPAIPLANLPVGEAGIVRQIEGTEVVRAYLQSGKMIPGASIRVLAASSNGSMLLQVGEGQLQLAQDLIGHIFIGSEA